MDLPTYTSIWRIEKRLYKLYDFRLPMPVPVGQIAVFAAITVPYVILLTILGLPFNHTLFWLYVLPPGVITWLATRPVLESKRLPELVISQVRYLGEPGIWCRMAPLAEKDDVVVIGKVWRRDEEPLRSPAAAPALVPANAPAAARRPARVRPAAARKAAAQAVPAHPSGRVPGAAPAPRPRTAGGRRGRATQWPAIAAGPAGPPPVTAADVPSEIAHDERQPPLHPAPAAGRHAARPAFPNGTPGLPAAAEDKIARPAQADGLAAPPRPPAAWPAKDPHAPASTAPAAPAWTPLVPPAPAPPVSGNWAMTAGPRVPAAADPIPAAADPVPPVPGDPDPGEPESLMGRADSLAAPEMARPASPAVSVPAQPASPEPLTGMPTGPAGFFIGPLQPEPADSGDAEPLAAQGEMAEHRTADPEAPVPDAPAPEATGDGMAGAEVAEPAGADAGGPEDETDGPTVAESVVAGPAVAEPADADAGGPEGETDGPAVAEPGVAGAEGAGDETDGPAVPEPGVAGAEVKAPDAAPDEAPDAVTPPAAAPASAPEALPEDAALAQPGFQPEPHAPGGASEQAGAEQPATPDDLAPADDPAAGDVAEGHELAPDEPGAPAGDAHEAGLPGEGQRDEDGQDEDLPGEPAAPAASSPPPLASPWTPPVVVVRGGSSVRPTLVERALSGPGQQRGGISWREHVRVVPGGQGPGRPDMERRDRARVQLSIHGPRLIVVLGCTVGAGQTVTTLVLADVLASLRGEPVAALDLNPGQTSLTDMARTSPAGTARGLLSGDPPAVPGQRGRGRLDLIAHDSTPDGGPRSPTRNTLGCSTYWRPATRLP